MSNQDECDMGKLKALAEEKLNIQDEPEQTNIKPVKKPRNVTCRLSQEELLSIIRDDAMKLPDMNLVVSGLAGRFPKADSVNEFEDNLFHGRDMVNDKDNSRFTCGLWGLPERAGRLNDLSKFDCEFFGFTPEDSNFIDFQMRILYEVVYESILDAGVNPASLRGSNTGIFFGLHTNEYEKAVWEDPKAKSSGYYAQFAVKVAQYFDFRGLTVTYDAACASGFVGLHNAIEALNHGLVDQAIVCSSNIPVHPTGSFIFLQMQMLSPTGFSRFLDARADGYVKSESCVSIFIQRKDVALRNYVSIMASMTSVDGYKPEGITFPSDKSQERLIRETKVKAGLSTNHIEYIEAHGTGTPAGDPQEARAITRVYFPSIETESAKEAALNATESKSRPTSPIDEDQEERKIGPLLVGSVKTNMGHSEAASGLCALVKVALMLEHELIYQGLHYAQPNANIEALTEGYIKFVTERRALNAKVVPMSCYGFGGSNVHAILRANHLPVVKALPSGSNIDQENSTDCSITRSEFRLVVMFGRSMDAVNQFFDQLMNPESRHTKYCLSDDFLRLVNALSEQKIDRLMDHRGYLVLEATSGRELCRSVRLCQLETANKSFVEDLGRSTHHQDHKTRSINLLFPGLGCERPTMAKGLSKFQPFWITIERLATHVEPLAIDLKRLLIEEDAFSCSACETAIAIVAYEIALINLLKSAVDLGRCKIFMGHSLGELACAYATDTLDERAAIMMAHAIGSAIDEVAYSPEGAKIEGRMIVVGIGEQRAQAELAKLGLLEGKTRVSCVNNPDSVTISGPAQEIARLSAELSRDKGVSLKELASPIALHNEAIMTPDVRNLLLGKMLSNLAKRGLDSLNTIEPTWTRSIDHNSEEKPGLVEYFASLICCKVQLDRSLDLLEPESVVLELGPTCLFEAQVRLSGERKKLHYVSFCQRSREETEHTRDLLASLGLLYQTGQSLKLSQVNGSGELADGRQSLPVRRQTPSLSSLFRWKYEHPMFVPRYPAQFSKSSAKCEIPVELLHDRDKFLVGHCVEGRILFPATGYLFLMWRIFSFVKRHIYDACFHDVEKQLLPVEFRNVHLYRAVILNQNRVSQLYAHYEEGTGRFEIKEGGSVVIDGYAHTPTEQATGLRYEQVRRSIESERLEITQTTEDIYKQFRVSGYDYGPTFQNILGASSDGRYSRVNFNGYFVALTDSILQTIFLAVSQYAPSGGLFLPTRLEYVRLQPEVIISKLRAAGMPLDAADGSLNTKAKREAMTKLMQREAGDANLEPEVSPNEKEAAEATTENQDSNDEQQSPKPECIFETYCDPISGVIITDGIEMRGIKATPAPRRSDQISDVLFESYQFVRDFEEPLQDENLLKHKQLVEPYSRVCDFLATKLLNNLFSLSPGECSLQSEIEKQTTQIIGLDSESQIEAYVEAQLASRRKWALQPRDGVAEAVPSSIEQEPGEVNTAAQLEEYDIKKNGNFTLLSVLDQILSDCNGPRSVGPVIKENRLHLMRDLIQDPISSERLMRPLMETVIENMCTKRMRLKLLEINTDDGILKDSLQYLAANIEPSLVLEYSLAHPDIKRLTSEKILNLNGGEGAKSVKTYTLCLDDMQSLFTTESTQLKELDMILYKDISCYTLPKLVVEKNGLGPILDSLNDALKSAGYAVILMRRKLTFAELVLLSLSDPQMAGLSHSQVDSISDCDARESILSGAVGRQLVKINEILEARYELMLDEARRNKMLCLARKCDQNGCSALLFKRTKPNEADPPIEGKIVGEPINDGKSGEEDEHMERAIVRIRHDDEHEVAAWLERLKSYFSKPEAPKAGELAVTEASGSESKENETSAEQQLQKSEPAEDVQQQAAQKRVVVWLCGVATKQNPLSGVVGMMQALRKELGSSNLRCFLDCHTFKNCDEPISIEQIEASANFREALERNQLWTCVDSEGHFGSYRHFTVNKFLSYEDCRCSEQTKRLDVALGSSLPVCKTDQYSGMDARAAAASAAYVNYATRGDLSSFSWFQAPFEHFDEQQCGQLVRVAYSALNFRDVMLATGRLPLDAIPRKIALQDCLLGLEFAGVELATGRRMMGMVSGRGVATHVDCPPEASLKVELPDHLSLRDASTIPVVYATAIMALIYRGRMQRGESILIHAGSGGVGQAAIRLAAHFGLQVFTTVGSAEKRQFLLDEFGSCAKLTNERIFSSRDCNFEAEIMKATQGRGVDLVLNSLADDKLQASLRCLADGGRFLEIGKYDMSVDSQMQLNQLDTNKTFHGILLDMLFETDGCTAFREQIRCVLATLKDGLSKGYIKPIKSTIFKSHQVEEAFRFMATGKHIGKVLVEIDPSLETYDKNQCQPKSLLFSPAAARLNRIPQALLSSQKSYLVTGGLGGFGMELCKWLVVRGARRLVISSRRGLRTGYQRATIERLEKSSGARVLVVTSDMADATTRQGARKLCQLVRDHSEVGEVGGLFHLAMVLKDSLLEKMTSEQFIEVCRPKLDSLYQLERALVELDLDEQVQHFVAFSSVTSGKGNAGQCNYAYANSCIERLCERRRARGKHALAIQWGAIGDVGVAFENFGGNDVVLGGTIPQRIPSCLATLNRLLCAPFSTCLSVVPVSRAADGLTGDKRDLVGAIFHVLGIKDSSKVSEQATLGELGLDSLMAVEIRQYIEREYDITLNIQEIRALTIAKIRDISENGKQAIGQLSKTSEAQTNPAVEHEPRQVASYGTQPSTTSGVDQKSAEEVKSTAAAIATAESPKLSSQADRLEAMFDKSHVSSFVPTLELPHHHFQRLGRRSKSTYEQRPIFFVPPIHGSFEQLEPICRLISRPCIGVNWTKHMGRVSSISEAVELHLKLLRNFRRWPVNQRRVVDLVGYSYGATIAFEIMVKLYEAQGASEDNNLDNDLLTPGRLVLLDGSPRQIELGSKILRGLTRRKPMTRGEKLDELLMGFVIAHTRDRKSQDIDYWQLQKSLASTSDTKEKIHLASELLSASLDDQINHLNSNTKRKPPNEFAVENGGAQNGTNREENNTSSDDDYCEVNDQIAEEDDDEDLMDSRSGRARQISFAIEAFCRRYELINNYKAKSCLPSDCSLIRARKVWLTKDQDRGSNYDEQDTSKEFNEPKFNEDLDLASVVKGRVHVTVLEGDHESFLELNREQVAHIINNEFPSTQ